MAIKIAFDIGNVLCHVDIEKFIKFLTNNVTNTITNEGAEDRAWLFCKSIQNSLDLGLTRMEYEVQKKWPFVTAQMLNDILEVWNNCIIPNYLMMDLLNDLNVKYEVAFLSNMGPEHISHLRKNHPSMFNGITQHISCEVGARKPTKTFFQSFILDQNNLTINGNEFINYAAESTHTGNYYDYNRETYVDECISGYSQLRNNKPTFYYIDDLKDNLAAGEKYGFLPVEFNLDNFSKLSVEEQKNSIKELKNLITSGTYEYKY